MGFTDIFKIGQFKSEIEQLNKDNQELQSKLQQLDSDFKSEIEQLNKDNQELRNKLQQLGSDDYFAIKQKTDTLSANYKKDKADYESELKSLEDRLTSSTEQLVKVNKQSESAVRKLNRCKKLYKAIEYSIDNYLDLSPTEAQIKLSSSETADIENYCPSIYLKLHCMDVKDLKKAYRDNDKQITSILKRYASRYTAKSNRAIYQLMVIALRAELQNILTNLKYEKLDTSIELVKNMTSKYFKIADEGNQSIAGTLAKFIGEIEYLFINAVKIEYNYYVKKEQAKQEQLAIREQMRQEAEERKALELEKKKVEKEEAKYNSEIENLKEQLANAKAEELAKLNERILELQAQLANVIVKKEEITSLANGKAGNVYVISNLGSFGENVFKIGMTRRLNPQDRVNELGNASVPFKFDVHSFIFSDDAVGLESKLHNILNSKRVNKVNLRKEFFYTTVDELEQLVTEIEPTAEFNKTMLAEEFKQSLSSDEVYSSDYELDDEGEED